MEKARKFCIDYGTENCPCYLALTKDCLVCDRLQCHSSHDSLNQIIGNCNDCKWGGACVYNEFIQNGKKINNPRINQAMQIIDKKEYPDGTTVFILDAGRGFAEKASPPGSFIFIKKNSYSDFYNIPISILWSDVEKGQIHIAIKPLSQKTKIILEEDNLNSVKDNNYITVRGVYRNGILGVDELFSQINNFQRQLHKTDNYPVQSPYKILILTKGIGFAPGVHLANYLINKSNGSKNYKYEIDFTMDTDKISTELIIEYLKLLNGNTESDFYKSLNVSYVSLSEMLQTIEHNNCSKILESEKNSNCKDSLIWPELFAKTYSSIVILTSDYYIEQFKRLLPITAYSNNFRLCCGEGICGACTIVDKNGETFRMCKCNKAL